MNKTIKIISLITGVIAILVITGSLCYYFLIFLPQQKEAELELQRQIRQDERESKCIELAENEHSRQENNKEISKGEFLGDFKYKYDKELDACFIYFSQNGNCYHLDDCETYEIIRSLFDNKIIGEYSYRNNDPSNYNVYNASYPYEFFVKGQQIFGDDFWK